MKHDGYQNVSEEETSWDHSSDFKSSSFFQLASIYGPLTKSCHRILRWPLRQKSGFAQLQSTFQWGKHGIPILMCGAIWEITWILRKRSKNGWTRKKRIHKLSGATFVGIHFLPIITSSMDFLVPLPPDSSGRPRAMIAINSLVFGTSNIRSTGSLFFYRLFRHFIPLDIILSGSYVLIYPHFNP